MTFSTDDYMKVWSKDIILLQPHARYNTEKQDKNIPHYVETPLHSGHLIHEMVITYEMPGTDSRLWNEDY